MSGLLANKTALVTNVSTKLGYAIAQRLGFAGANIFISDAHDQKLRNSVHNLKELGLNVAGAVVDVADSKHREQLFEEVEKKFSGLDVLVINPLTNALKGSILDSSKMDFDKMRLSLFRANWFHRPPPISAAEYTARRNSALELAKQELKTAGEVAIIAKGATRTAYGLDVYYPFKQNSYFRYLTGSPISDCYLFSTASQSVLFTKEVNDHSAMWDGRRYSEAELRRISGVNQILGLKEFENFVSTHVEGKHVVYEADDFKNSPLLERLVKLPQTKLNCILDKLRWIKSPAEIELMRTTCKIGSNALNATIKESRAVPNEAFIVGRLEYEYRRRGAAGSAYVPVVAAGERANTIHYIDGDQDIKPDDCVLVDAGCDFDGYVSDISRSFPVSGTFTDAQKTLYDALNIVHGECLNLVMEKRPLKLNELYFFMLRRMAHHFMAAKIFKAGVLTEEALGICDDLCPHHISHYLGLDVHDTFGISRSIELPPDVIITVEPGVYVRHSLGHVHKEFYGIGYRIEDDVLITKTGAEVLTASAIRCSNEIEKLMTSTE